MKVVEINFLDIEENKEYENTISKVVEKCFEEENLQNKNLYINVILTNPKNIKETNKKYSNINRKSKRTSKRIWTQF